VVYEVGDWETVAPEPALTLSLPPYASSWTPSGSECLRRGRSYAWSVRVIGNAEPSEWARARFFSIAAAPSDEELLAALEVVRAHIAATQSDPGARGLELHGAGLQGDIDRPADTDAADRYESHSEGGIREASAGAVPAFRVTASGDVEATSFSGDGSNLRNIGSAAIAAGAVGASEIATNAVGESEIATDAVEATDIAADAVGSSEITANAVGASEIGAGAVGASEMAGSFCLVRRGSNPCPPGYTEYLLGWDTEDTLNNDICTEEVAVACGDEDSPFSSMYVYFCCA
jgi:hypothetical protein